MPSLLTWCGCICLRHTNTRRIYWHKWRLEMFSVVSEFSFVRSLNSALYHEHYIGNSEWVNRERFRTRLRCAQLCMCGRSMFHTCGPLLNMSVWKLVRYASVPNRAPRTETVQYKYMYRYTPTGYISVYHFRLEHFLFEHFVNFFKAKFQSSQLQQKKRRAE